MVGKAKLQAYLLKLQTVNKLSVAQEIRDQTLKETQEVSNALIAAEQRIGELLLSIPKQTANQYTSATSPNGEKAKSKSDVASEMGYTRKNVDEYQQMAKNPEIVQRVIDDALANGEVVTKSQVLKEIKAEREKLKAEVDVRLAEKDRRIKALETDGKEREDYISQREEYIHELENREAEVKVVEKKVEVMPEDYEELKKRYKGSLEDYRILEDSKQKYFSENQALKRRIKDLEERKDIAELQKKLEEEAGYFAIRTYDYIQKNGGYVWITERMEQLPKKQRKEFIQTIYAIDAFAKQMVENIGGYNVE